MITSDEAQDKSRELLAWIRAKGLSIEDVVPLCAMVAGTVIRIQALMCPPDEFPARLTEGVEIACGMLEASAYMPVKQ